MVLSYFLFRMEGDTSDPHEVILLSFNSNSIMTRHYDTFLVYLKTYIEL